MKVEKLANGVLTGATPYTSATFTPGRAFSDQAILQVAQSAGNFSMTIQGRVANEAACPWYTIDTVTQADLNADRTHAQLVQGYPFMRIVLASTTGTFYAWLGI